MGFSCGVIPTAGVAQWGEGSRAGVTPDVVPGTPNPSQRLKNGSVQDDSRGDKIFAGLAPHHYARLKRRSS